MKVKSHFNISDEQRAEIREHLRNYFTAELDVDLGNLEIDLFIDFLSSKVGKYYYNHGVLDVISAIKDKTEDLVILIKE